MSFLPRTALPLARILDPLVESTEVVVFAVAHAVGGAVLGAIQWFVLRKHGRLAVLWVPLSAVLWGFLMIVWYSLFDVAWIPGRLPIVFEGDHELRQLLRVTASTALITGPVLLWMLRHLDLPAHPSGALVS